MPKHLLLIILITPMLFNNQLEAKEVVKQQSKIDAKLARIKAKMSVRSRDTRRDKVIKGNKAKDGSCNVNVGSQENNGVAVNTQINMVAKDVIVICEK
ncbi:hypothetical protein HG263_10305 [Pseudoalteromonas sp. JBTF-M23]|uniref:Uncharacterized protein n=1 Tax=Pseudoalteromonas caenipelagi TaxID=2726988 RepID=A0A849VC34_9GAMM|nr:hypothetical protein [Pseudoalteromonas caenipelagi]NOU50922.1 hypothetical protein [Pseudoalteromonas caenipelagi]